MRRAKKDLRQGIICFSVIYFLLVLTCYVSSAAEPIIIDHTCTDLKQVPESAINQAKANLHIAYGHTSHGSQIIAGMGRYGTELDDFLSGSPAYNTTPGLYVWDDHGSGGSLDLDDYAMGGDVGYYPQWVNNTRSYLGTPDPNTGMGTTQPDVNVIIWSWCGQASGRTQQSMIDTYLAPMTQLELDYFGVTFVYMTGHLDGGGETGNLHLRNQQIRDYCTANSKVLYDFADIESYDPDGLVNYMELGANDNCDYDSDGNGSRDRNWAVEWQNSHTEGTDWWASGAAHSQHLNGNRKGFAAWWLWAVLGGWGQCSNGPSSLTARPDSAAGQMDLSWQDNSDDEDSFILHRSVDGGPWDNNYAVVPADVTSFADSGLLPGVYDYMVAAHKDDGDGNGNPCDSTTSNTASEEIINTLLPRAPTQLSATGDSVSGMVDLAWQDNADNEQVCLIGRQVDGGVWDDIYDSVPADVTTYRDDNKSVPPLPNGSYTYRVVASNSHGNSTPSNSATAVISQLVPEDPSDLDSRLEGFDIQLSWTDNSDNEELFIIERRIDAGAWELLEQLPADAVSHTDQALVPLHTYTYRVKAVNNFGDSDYSSETFQTLYEEYHTITLKQGVEGYAGCRDTYLKEDAPTYNLGSDPYDYVRNSPKENYLIVFDLPVEVQGKKILSATLTLYCWSVSGWASNQYFDLYKVTEAWEEGSANNAYQQGSASWEIREGDQPWVTPGGTIAPEIITSTLIQSSGFYPAFDITGTVQAWASGSCVNNGILLKNDTPVSTGIKAGEYSEYGRPVLEITYTNACTSDADTDSDIDGSDLAAMALNFFEACLVGFASLFGQ